MSDIERKHMSEPTPVRRFEVFTGAGRRRRWAAEAKAEIVAESFASSGTVSSVARRHGLTAQQLFAWRRAARQSGAVARSTSAKPKLPAVAFAPVVVETAGSRAAVRRPPAKNAASGRALSGTKGPGTIEVTIARVVIRVPRGVDAGTLAQVLRRFKAAP